MHAETLLQLCSTHVKQILYILGHFYITEFFYRVFSVIEISRVHSILLVRKWETDTHDVNSRFITIKVQKTCINNFNLGITKYVTEIRIL